MALPDSCYKWRCEECKELHDDEDDARDCCRPSIREVFVCPVCASVCDDEDDALDCCQFDDSEPPRVSAAELERQGQTRLF